MPFRPFPPADPGTRGRMCTHSGPERAKLARDEPQPRPERTAQPFARPNPGRIVAVGGGPDRHSIPPLGQDPEGDYRTTPWLPPFQRSSALGAVGVDGQPVRESPCAHRVPGDLPPPARACYSAPAAR